MSLHYQQYGEEGHALIILHGLFGSLGNWHTLCKKWSSELKVYALDQRNHGQSFHSDEFNYHVMADDLKQFIDEKGLKSVYLLGHSMGGKTAMFFAVKYPDYVDKLIVADMAPKIYQNHHTDIFEALFSVDLPKYQSRNDVDKYLADKVPDFAVRQFLMKNLARNDEGNFYWRMNLSAIYKNYDQIGEAVPSEAKFDKPALFIRGGRSPYVKDSDEALINTIFPQYNLVTIANAGHWVHAEAPEHFYKIVNEFLYNS